MRYILIVNMFGLYLLEYIIPYLDPHTFLAVKAINQETHDICKRHDLSVVLKHIDLNLAQKLRKNPNKLTLLFELFEIPEIVNLLNNFIWDDTFLQIIIPHRFTINHLRRHINICYITGECVHCFPLISRDSPCLTNLFIYYFEALIRNYLSSYADLCFLTVYITFALEHQNVPMLKHILNNEQRIPHTINQGEIIKNYMPLNIYQIVIPNGNRSYRYLNSDTMKIIKVLHDHRPNLLYFLNDGTEKGLYKYLKNNICRFDKSTQQWFSKKYPEITKKISKCVKRKIKRYNRLLDII